MQGIEIKRRVKLSLSAGEWQLYSSMPGAKKAARSLNAAVAKAINASADKRSGYQAACQAMVPFADFGAIDSEPRYVLQDIIDKVYG